MESDEWGGDCTHGTSHSTRSKPLPQLGGRAGRHCASWFVTTSEGRVKRHMVWLSIQQRLRSLSLAINNPPARQRPHPGVTAGIPLRRGVRTWAAGSGTAEDIR